MPKSKLENGQAIWVHESGKNGSHRHIDRRQQQARQQTIQDKQRERRQMLNQKPSKDRKKALRRIDAEIKHITKKHSEAGESHAIRAKGSHNSR